MVDLKKLKKIIHSNIDLIFAALNIDGQDFGNKYYCECPVHEGADNPKAFCYNLDNHYWKCWTHNCHETFNYDVFGLIRGVLSQQQGENVSFSEVLKWACQVLNIDKKDIDLGTVIKEKCDDEDNFNSILRKFNKSLSGVLDKPGPEHLVEIPSPYYLNRKYQLETLIEFEVGDSLDNSNKNLMRYRAVIPIHNHDGTIVVGSSGRATEDYILPKFYNDPGFNKSDYLYNYHRAKGPAFQEGRLYIVEGPGDVWRMWEAGVKNCVGLLGKDISPRQEALINQLGVTQLVIILDHDQAAREAKIKIQREFQRYYDLKFVQVESRADLGNMTVGEIQELIC